MIIKRRTKPRALQKLDALIPRLSPHFPRISEMKKDQAKRYKGYIGELNADYHLEKLPDSFVILQGVSLASAGIHFHPDTIVIGQFGIYIVECKNYGGTITFDTTLNQFFRDDGEKQYGYRNPITQAEEQQYHLQKWLLQRNVHIPVHVFVVICDPGTIINVIGDREYIGRIVAHAEHIPSKVLEKEKELGGQGGISPSQVRRVGAVMLQEAREQDRNIMGAYDVKWQDLLPGVECPGCGWIGMARKDGKWHCEKCGEKSKIAHQKAIMDYLLLSNNGITNRECRYFLKIKSRAMATRFLQQNQLVYKSEYRRWYKT